MAMNEIVGFGLAVFAILSHNAYVLVSTVDRLSRIPRCGVQISWSLKSLRNYPLAARLTADRRCPVRFGAGRCGSAAACCGQALAEAAFCGWRRQGAGRCGRRP